MLDIWEQPFGDISKNMDAPRLWSIGRPYLYTLCLELIKEGQVVDTFETRFGFRTVSFTEQGFFLNGKRCQDPGTEPAPELALHGLWSSGPGTAAGCGYFKAEAGMQPPCVPAIIRKARHLLTGAMRSALLVFTEIPGWQHIGDEDWKNQVYDNVREMVLQYGTIPAFSCGA